MNPLVSAMESVPTSQFDDEPPHDDVMVQAGLQPTGYLPSCLAQEVIQNRTRPIVTFLLSAAPEFVALAELRRKGWENPAGDRHFSKQRRNADKLDTGTSQYHYHLMQRIGTELHHTTMGLATRTFPGNIFDFCVAPGGFLATAMKLNEGAEVVGFSLPHSLGGYNVLLPDNNVTFLDITMLAADMGTTDIPTTHPDVGNFLPRQLSEDQLFELVICDGHVLRTHTRASYRETREPTRLKTTQLALGLEHMKPGGTMLVLFQKLEAWDTICYIRRFSEFSTVQLYKPKAGHAIRSSFYMVARDVHSRHPKALLAIEKWKKLWKAATFGTDEVFAEALSEGEPDADDLLEEFRRELLAQGSKVWAVQAQALSQARFTQGKRVP